MVVPGVFVTVGWPKPTLPYGLRGLLRALGPTKGLFGSTQ